MEEKIIRECRLLPIFGKRVYMENVGVTAGRVGYSGNGNYTQKNGVKANLKMSKQNSVFILIMRLKIGKEKG